MVCPGEVVRPCAVPQMLRCHCSEEAAVIAAEAGCSSALWGLTLKIPFLNIYILLYKHF